MSARKTKLFKDRKGTDLVPNVSSRDGSTKLSPQCFCADGETRKDFVKSKACVDYARWVALFVGRSENECKKWLDKYRKAVLKLCIPYEVR